MISPLIRQKVNQGSWQVFKEVRYESLLFAEPYILSLVAPVGAGRHWAFHALKKELTMLPQLKVLILLLVVIVMCGCAAVEQSGSDEAVAPSSSIDTIVFADYNWSSAQIQNRIAQYIVEKGYGYPTDVVFGATLPLFQGLRRGDIHVSLEIWLPNMIEAWSEAEANGEVIEVGTSLGHDWQSLFVIPAYLQEEYPDLDRVDDLRDERFKALFATPETGGKARLVSCTIGWVCEEVNAAQIVGYELEEHVHIINPGDGAALNADLYGAYEKGKPWVGYQWGTNDPPLLLDLVRLEEPAYSDECWSTTKACAYEDATIVIAVHPDLKEAAPDVIEMLGAWGFRIGVYREVAAWLDENSDASSNDAALWWLTGNVDVWSSWVSDDAAASIESALAANEIPEGWPIE